MQLYGGFAGDETALGDRDFLTNKTVLDGEGEPEGEGDDGCGGCGGCGGSDEKPAEKLKRLVGDWLLVGLSLLALLTMVNRKTGV